MTNSYVFTLVRHLRRGSVLVSGLVVCEVEDRGFEFDVLLWGADSLEERPGLRWRTWRADEPCVVLESAHPSARSEIPAKDGDWREKPSEAPGSWAEVADVPDGASVITISADASLYERPCLRLDGLDVQDQYVSVSRLSEIIASLKRAFAGGKDPDAGIDVDGINSSMSELSALIERARKD